MLVYSVAYYGIVRGRSCVTTTAGTAKSEQQQCQQPHEQRQQNAEANFFLGRHRFLYPFYPGGFHSSTTFRVFFPAPFLHYRQNTTEKKRRQPPCARVRLPLAAALLVQGIMHRCIA